MESQQSDRLHKYTVCDVANFSPTEISFFYLLEKNKNFIALQQQQQQQQRWTKIKWDSIPVWIIYLVEWLHGDALEKKSKKNRTHSSATSCLKLQCQMTALNGTSDAFRAMTCWIWIWSFFFYLSVKHRNGSRCNNTIRNNRKIFPEQPVLWTEQHAVHRALPHTDTHGDADCMWTPEVFDIFRSNGLWCTRITLLHLNRIERERVRPVVDASYGNMVDLKNAWSFDHSKWTFCSTATISPVAFI